MNFDNAEVRRIIIYFPWEIPSFPVFLYLPEKTFGSFLFLPSHCQRQAEGWINRHSGKNPGIRACTGIRHYELRRKVTFKYHCISVPPRILLD